MELIGISLVSGEHVKCQKVNKKYSKILSIENKNKTLGKSVDLRDLLRNVSVIFGESSGSVDAPWQEPNRKIQNGKVKHSMN